MRILDSLLPANLMAGLTGPGSHGQIQTPDAVLSNWPSMPGQPADHRSAGALQSLAPLGDRNAVFSNNPAQDRQRFQNNANYCRQVSHDASVDRSVRDYARNLKRSYRSLLNAPQGALFAAVPPAAPAGPHPPIRPNERQLAFDRSRADALNQAVVLDARDANGLAQEAMALRARSTDNVVLAAAEHALAKAQEWQIHFQPIEKEVRAWVHAQEQSRDNPHWNFVNTESMLPPWDMFADRGQQQAERRRALELRVRQDVVRFRAMGLPNIMYPLDGSAAERVMLHYNNGMASLAQLRATRPQDAVIVEDQLAQAEEWAKWFGGMEKVAHRAESTKRYMPGRNG